MSDHLKIPRVNNAKKRKESVYFYFHRFIIFP